MGLSEDEVDARLLELRRKRALLDREIADLLLYLELGRRLSGVRIPSSDDTSEVQSQEPVLPRTRSSSAHARGPANPLAGSRREGAHRPYPPKPPRDTAPTESSDPAIPPAVAFADDPTAARRYGRALIVAARELLTEAGRPLHARDILARLVARGFSVPGPDPVAALNTRLWKRAIGGGPLRRLGEASYAMIIQNAGEVEDGGDIPR